MGREGKIKRLAAEWIAIDADLETLWQKEGKPRSAAWFKIAQPLLDRMEETEKALAPVLFEWAKAERLTGRDVFGFWRTDYGKVRERTGLKMHGNVIRQMIQYAADEEAKRSLEEVARAMPDDEWDAMMARFCTSTPEGQATKDYLLESRKQREEAA